MESKNHLNINGFLTILTYYASINLGVSSKLTKFYPNIIPVKRPNIFVRTKLDPNWISGFTAGEGGFSLILFQPNTSKERVGYQFSPSGAG